MFLEAHSYQFYVFPVCPWGSDSSWYVVGVKLSLQSHCLRPTGLINIKLLVLSWDVIYLTKTFVTGFVITPRPSASVSPIAYTSTTVLNHIRLKLVLHASLHHTLQIPGWKRHHMPGNVTVSLSLCLAHNRSSVNGQRWEKNWKQ